MIKMGGTLGGDWRYGGYSSSSNTFYRFRNSWFRFHYGYLLMLSLFLIIFLYITTTSSPSTSPLSSLSSSSLSSLSSSSSTTNWSQSHHQLFSTWIPNSYNYTYPLTIPITSSETITLRIGMIADLDQNSNIIGKKNTWQSFFKKGYIRYNFIEKTVAVHFDMEKPTELLSHYALNGRGMELSELVTFNGSLYTCDDRTGFIFELLPDNKLIPFVVLMDGNGRTQKGFKCEWLTVKDEILYVGSMGKEWTTSTGEFSTFDPMFVKAVTITGQVFHLNWIENYKKIRAAIGIEWPGYMIHESGIWSHVHRRWFFLPRRCSKEKYNETKDEYNGCNVLISADEYFNNIKVITLSEIQQPTHGFSSMKFLPSSNDTVIVALLTEEVNGTTSTFITAFTIYGKMLLSQEKIETNYKYEGIEFI